MRNTILATVVALGLSAVAFGANNPSTPAPAAAPATAAASAAAPAKPVDPKLADCQKQAKEKGLKGADHKKFVQDCVKKA